MRLEPNFDTLKPASRKATVSQGQTTLAPTYSQPATLDKPCGCWISRFAQLSIWLGRSLDPKHCALGNAISGYNWQDFRNCDLGWRTWMLLCACPKSVIWKSRSELPFHCEGSLRTPWKPLPMDRNTSYWKPDLLWESFELELENQKPACQRTKTFEPQVPISTAPTQEFVSGTIYKGTLFRVCIFQFCLLALQKLDLVAQSYRTFVHT